MGERRTHHFGDDTKPVCGAPDTSAQAGADFPTCAKCRAAVFAQPAVDTEAAEVQRGWGWPQLSRKAHYFVNGMSLCRKWMYTGALTPNQSTERGPDDCAECHKRVAAYGRSQTGGAR